MNNSYITILFIIISVVIVAAKLLLEHQKAEDKANGYVDADENYTIIGILKLLKNKKNN